MAESDDESNPRGDREKFTKERYNMDRNSRNDHHEGFERRHDTSGDREDRSFGFTRRDVRDTRKRSFRDYDHDRKESFSRESHSPPSKRHRILPYHSHDNRKSRGSGSSYSNQDNEFSKLECDKFKLRSFREFVLSLDEDVDEQTAIKRYREYRSMFHKSKISSFFINHQSEEWMMNRYHPRYVKELKLKRMRITKKRLRTFMDLFKRNCFDNVALSYENKNLVPLLNAVCLLLENEKLPQVYATKRNSELGKTETCNDDVETFRRTEKDSSNHISETSESSNCSEQIDWEKLADLVVTKSLFVRNYPNSSKIKVLNKELKSVDGYLRFATSEPAAKRKFSQRAWITFSKDCDLKAACVSVNDLLSEDIDLYSIINQDVPRKIRPVDSVSTCYAAVKADLAMAIQLIKALDASNLVYKTWSRDAFGVSSLSKSASSSEDSTTVPTESINLNIDSRSHSSLETELYEFSSDDELEVISKELPSKNPIWDHPVWKSVQIPEYASEFTNDKEIPKLELRPCEDKSLFQVLDLCIMYLRVVHSVDFYILITYLNEQDMPQRCGVINVRTSPISSQSEYAADKVLSWINDRRQKVRSITDPTSNHISAEDAVSLGLKDREEERKKFFELNTVKLASDKWLCTLSGKKFKGPEYVEKHINTKHGDKLQKVLEGVEYFNNYLLDRMRPSVPADIVTSSSNDSSSTHSIGFVNSAIASIVSRANQQNFMKSSSTGRKIISYSDKEAPAVDSMDFF